MKIFFLRHTSLDVKPDIFYGQTYFVMIFFWNSTEMLLLFPFMFYLTSKAYNIYPYKCDLRCTTLQSIFTLSNNVIALLQWFAVIDLCGVSIGRRPDRIPKRNISRFSQGTLYPKTSSSGKLDLWNIWTKRACYVL